MADEISTNEWDSGSLDASVVASFASDRPSHSGSVMRDSYASLCIHDDHSTVTVQSRMQIRDRIAG